jgi:hypothetical protein
LGSLFIDLLSSRIDSSLAHMVGTDLSPRQPPSAAVTRLIDDSWVAIAMFLGRREMLSLSRASRALRRVALSNAVWEWLLRRDYPTVVLETVQAAPLAWVPEGGMPHACDDTQFVRTYFRLLRLPCEASHLDASHALTIDAIFSLPHPRGDPFAQMRMLLRGMGATGVKFTDDPDSRNFMRARVPVEGEMHDDAVQRAPEFLLRSLRVAGRNFVAPAPRPEKQHQLSDKERIALIEQEIDPRLGFAIACFRLRRHVHATTLAVGKCLAFITISAAVFGTPFVGGRPFNVAALEWLRMLVAGWSITPRNVCLGVYGGASSYMSGILALPESRRVGLAARWQWSAGDVVEWTRAETTPGDLPMAHWLATTPKLDGLSLAYAAVAVTVACGVAVALGYREVQRHRSSPSSPSQRVERPGASHCAVNRRR